MPLRVDEMFADFLGYSGPDWDQLIYVIYETRRFVRESIWREQLKGLPKAEIVIVKGIPRAETVPLRRRARGR